MRFAVSTLLLAGLLGATTGCVAVKPWERDRLAQPAMALEAQLGDGFRAHMLPIREGAAGGEAGMGGGCGCD